MTNLILCLSLATGFAWAQTNPYQTRNSHFGVSGGNIKDISKMFCCSGTLGSLVQDSTGTQYILSNNHVLGRADQAAAGEDISQPGLIDNSCRAGMIVADFSAAPALGSNVDAAIAALRSGTMDATGFVEGIGTISSVVKEPTLGLSVAKSGRTTGFTTGNISSVNTRVTVQYQKGCNSGKKFTVTYTDQVVINSSTFSAGGDSGSLIVTNDTCHQPVALLFAGSSSTTIGNPIGRVLSEVGGALGKTVSFIGGTCNISGATGSVAPSDALISFASSVKEQHAPALMARGGVVGVGVGMADNNPAEAVLVVYVDHTQGANPQLPEQISGLRVKRVFTDPFVARPACSACSTGNGKCN